MKAKTLSLSELCNNNCLFCSARGRISSRTVEEIKISLYEAKKAGIQRIDISGGEPTEHPGLLEILKTCRDLNFKHVHLKTNGRKLKDREFLKEILGCGVNGFLFSIHGHIPEIHDRITGSNGSLSEALEGIKNLRELDRYAELNTLTVINRLNFRHLRETAEFLINQGTKFHIFVFIYPIAAALINFDQVVPYYLEARDSVIKALELNNDNFSNPMVKIDNYPFCLIPGMEKFSNMILVDQLELPYNIKREKCKDCFYWLICEGIPKEYVARRGWHEFKPLKKEQMPLNLKKFFKIIGEDDCMVLNSHFIEREWGGILIGSDTCILTHKGATLLKRYRGNLPLMEIHERFGSAALGFLYNLESRNLLKLLNGKKKRKETIVKFEAAESSPEFEFSLKNAA